MTMRKAESKKEQAAVTGSRQAVEASIDASKGCREQTWDQAAQKSSVAPWTKDPAAKKHCKQ